MTFAYKQNTHPETESIFYLYAVLKEDLPPECEGMGNVSLQVVLLVSCSFLFNF